MIRKAITAATPAVKIAIAVFFLGVGLAGPPLQPLSIFAALLICAALGTIGGRYVAAMALAALVAVGFLQHHTFRVIVLAGAAIVGLAARYAEARPRAATMLAAAGAIVGTAFLFIP